MSPPDQRFVFYKMLESNYCAILIYVYSLVKQLSAGGGGLLLWVSDAQYTIYYASTSYVLYSEKWVMRSYCQEHVIGRSTHASVHLVTFPSLLHSTPLYC